MSVFGGHGVMEDFSALPRLYRDSAVNELWEGPRNVLLTQIYRDLKRVMEWYKPAQFVRNILSGLGEEASGGLEREITELLESPDLYEKSHNTVALWRRWDLFCADFFHAYQDLALLDVEKNWRRG
jgi:hypothetical protein